MKTAIFATAVAAFFSTPLFAQNMTVKTDRTTFGIRAGINFQNITGKDVNDNDLNNSITTGFHAGVNAEIPVGTGSYIQPGVIYSMKGAQLDDNNDTKVKLSYIEIPVNFIYKPILGTGNMILGFGPYVGIGVGGKLTGDNGTNVDVEFTNDYNTAMPSAYQLKRTDAGANFLVGYEFMHRVTAQLNAQLGLVNLVPEGYSDNAKYKNTGFGLSVGYRF